MSALESQTFSPTPVPHPTLGKRILRMKAVWAALGAIVGASVGMECGGFIGAIVVVMAGMVEFATLGALFALIGGRPKETILGAVGGLLGGLAVGMIGGQASVVLLANVGLVVGAIVGATLRAYLWLLSLPVVLLGRILRPRNHRPGLVTLRQEGVIDHHPTRRPSRVGAASQ